MIVSELKWLSKRQPESSFLTRHTLSLLHWSVTPMYVSKFVPALQVEMVTSYAPVTASMYMTVGDSGVHGMSSVGAYMLVLLMTEPHCNTGDTGWQTVVVVIEKYIEFGRQCE